MIKTIAIIGFLSLAVAFNSYAQDSDRIDQLEKEIQEIKLRLSKLESMLGKPSTTQEVVSSSEGWKSIENWKKLTRDMSTSDVKRILGEPQYESGGIVAYWDYPNGGKVFFDDGKLSAWSEPRQ